MDLERFFHKHAGGEAYIPKRFPVDWHAVLQRWRSGETQQALATELGVRRETINRRLKALRDL